MTDYFNIFWSRTLMEILHQSKKLLVIYFYPSRDIMKKRVDSPITRNWPLLILSLMAILLKMMGTRGGNLCENHERPSEPNSSSNLMKNERCIRFHLEIKTSCWKHGERLTWKQDLESGLSGREGQTQRIFLFVNLVDFTDFRQEKHRSKTVKWSDDFTHWGFKHDVYAIVQASGVPHAIQKKIQITYI